MKPVTATLIRERFSSLLPAGDVAEAPVLVEGKPTCAVVRHLQKARQTIYLVWLEATSETLVVKLVVAGQADEHLAIERATTAVSGVRLQLSWWRQASCVQRAWLFEETGSLANLAR